MKGQRGMKNSQFIRMQGYVKRRTQDISNNKREVGIKFDNLQAIEQQNSVLNNDMGGNAMIALIDGGSNYNNEALEFPFNAPYINNNAFPSKHGERIVRKQHINVLNRPKTHEDYRRKSNNNTALQKSADLRSLSNKSPKNQDPCRESLKDYENSAVNQAQNQNQHTETNN